MKIKTITRAFKWQGEFDNLVNEAIAEGWHLVRRDVVCGGPNDYNTLYAELVLPDPPAEAEHFDPFHALQQVREFCAGNVCDHCPLDEFCARHLAGNEGPTDWDIPEEV